MSKKTIIGKVKEFAENTYKKDKVGYNWEMHIKPVLHYALKLADIKKADKEVLEVSVYLHDLGTILYGNDDHHETGARDAEKLLTKLGVEKDFIEQVKHCILTHRASKEMKPKTIEAEILKTADAMAHYDAIPWLIKIGLHNTQGDLKGSIKWVLDKVNRNWEKKILFPEAKEMVKEKYEAAKLLLEAALRYF